MSKRADMTHVNGVVKTVIESAMKRWGKGWEVLSPEQRKGAVSIEIVRVLTAQHAQYEGTLDYLQQVAWRAQRILERGNV